MKINNIKINKKTILSVLTAGSIALTTVGCGTFNATELSFKEVLDNPTVQEITILDEELNNNESVQENFAEIEKLETALEVMILNGKEDFSEVEQLIPLTEEEKEEALKLNIDEIKELKKVSKNNDTDLLSIENRLIAIKKIAYLDKYYRDFVMNDGLRVSKKALMNSVKASIGSEKNCDIDEIFITDLPNPKSDDFDIQVKAKGQEYTVKTSNDSMWNAIEYIDEIDSCNLDIMTEDDIKDTCIKALNYAKSVTLHGSNINDDKIVEQYSDRYIKKNIFKK